MSIMITTFFLLFLLRLKAVSAEDFSQLCTNTPGWELDLGPTYDDDDSSDQYVDCNDKSVSCEDMGSLGLATDHCCKCKTECNGKCEKANEVSSIVEMTAIGFGIVILLIIGAVAYHYCYFRFKLREIRRVMLERRRQMQENPNKDEKNQKTNEEDLQAIFSFQVVPPENDADIENLDQTQRSDSKTDEEHDNFYPDLKGDEDDPSCACTNKNKEAINPLKSLLRQECCICLEKYSPGEIVCVSKSGSCNHIFHKECISEWINRDNRCPFCRTKLEVQT